ncbi:MAG TPA: flagellar protein FlgN [Solimonas sp.]
MTPPTAAERLRSNLRQHLDSLGLLAELLQQEHTALSGDDPGALEQITRAKANAAEHLHTLGRELQALRTPDTAQSADWTAVQALAGRCQSANAANATLLDLRTRSVRSRLQVLRGPPVATVYDRSGSAYGAGSRRLGLA